MNVLLERLQEAIDEAISDSGSINCIVDEMKRSGFDVCLIVESSAAISPVAVSPMEGAQPPDSASDPGDFQLTAQDLALLLEMKIAA